MSNVKILGINEAAEFTRSFIDWIYELSQRLIEMRDPGDYDNLKRTPQDVNLLHTIPQKMGSKHSILDANFARLCLITADDKPLTFN